MVKTMSNPVVVIGATVTTHPRAECTVPGCWTNGTSAETVSVAAQHVRTTGHQVVLSSEHHRLIGLPE